MSNTLNESVDDVLSAMMRVPEPTLRTAAEVHEFANRMKAALEQLVATLTKISNKLGAFSPYECDEKEPSPERMQEVLEYWEERGVKPPTDEKGMEDLRYEAVECMDGCDDCVCATCPIVELRNLVDALKGGAK